MAISSPHTWEKLLLARAWEAQQSHTPACSLAGVDPRRLDQAYRHCSSLTRKFSQSFFLATALLPRLKSQAMRALYAFCRVSDDLVDHPAQEAGLALAEWRRRSLSAETFAENPVSLAWAHTRQRYHIPPRYAEQLLEGVARDLSQKRYHTFQELASYAYGVASTVGLMSMHIIGFSSRAAIPYAIKLGVALQLTNILRDVGEDWRAGRLYLPANELAAYGLAEADLEHAIVDERWRYFMRFQIERNRRLYAEAWPGIRFLNRDGRLAVAAAGDFYRAILDKIEANDYDVFHRRAFVRPWEKLRHLPRLWQLYR